MSHVSRNSPDPRRPAAPSITKTRYGTLMKYTIPSDFARGREVQTQILDEVQNFKYNSDSVFAIKLSLEEAIVNAIKHGNKLDMNKKVYVEALVGPDQVELTIEDDGPGFTRQDVPDPDQPGKHRKMQRPRHPADRGLHDQRDMGQRREADDHDQAERLNLLSAIVLN